MSEQDQIDATLSEWAARLTRRIAYVGIAFVIILIAIGTAGLIL